MASRSLHRFACALSCAVALVACGGGGSSPPPDADPGDPIAPTPVAVQVTELSSGLSNPWGIAFLPGGGMLVTERAGNLKLVGADGVVQGNIIGVPPVVFQGQGGLLDVVLDPAFAQNGRIYLSYSEADAGDPTRNGTAVARAVLDVGTRLLSQVTVIYRQLPKVASTMHFGSRLVFGRDGHLFVTMGERNERNFAQDLTRGHGKIARITTDGNPAPGNPAWATAGAQPEFWSLGHRNPQGAALHPDTGELWSSEHGAQGGDEVNRVLRGLNYGWPIASHSQEYGTTTPVGPTTLAGTEPPSWVWEKIDGSAWTPGTQKSSPAPSGMVFYTGAVVPQWRGSLFVGSLAGEALWRLTLDGNTITGQERLLAERGQRIRDVEQSPDGALVLLTDDGKLLRYGP